MKIEALITDNMDIWTTAIKKRSATGRGSNKKIELTGIKKLRELILELAVRGKLVPQDPNDEPASVLLEKIAAEKAQLTKDKKIKKTKALPAIVEGEKSFELPNGWEWCRLMELVYLLGDGLHGTPEYTLNDKYYFINGNNLKDGKIIIKHETKTVAQDQFDKYKKDLSSNTVLVSINGTLGNVAFYNNEKIVLGKSACYFNLANSIYKSYIKLVIESPRFLKYAFEKATGSTIKNLGLKAMNELPLALPSLSEQHRIVAKVDELMRLCDQLEQQTEDSITAHQTIVETLLATLSNSENPAEFNQNWTRIAEHFDTLFITEHSIDQLKQTILQLAVMGKLVPQNSNDEPASILLEKIAAEKERLIKDKVIKKQKPMLSLKDIELPFSLPSNWQWSMLGELCHTLADGPHFSPRYVEKTEGVMFLSTRNISIDSIDLTTAKYVSREDHESFCKRVKVKKGDILYTKGGTTGIAKVNDLEIEFSVWVHLAVLQIPNKKIHNKYVAIALNSPHCYQQSQEYTNGIGNKDLGLTRMINITMPFPPLSEQHRIVTKVDELMTLCDQLKTRLNQAQTTQLQLADTIIEQAVN